jgi:hypothetical protein
LGTVLDQVRILIPGTYRAMLHTSNTWTEPDFQAHADFVKFRLFATVANVTQEATYDPMLAGFVGKLTTIRIIPAAIDFWGNQLESETHQAPGGQRENVTFPERRDHLWKIYERLLGEVNKEFGILADKYDFASWVTSLDGIVPKVDLGDEEFKVTADPALVGEAMSADVVVETLDWRLVP